MLNLDEHERNALTLNSYEGPAKSLIYIGGCGRSGTTIIGFCIGNASETIDLGEVIDYARRCGKPIRFKEYPESREFWQAVTKRLQESPDWIGLTQFAKLQRRLDTHASFLPLLLVPFVLRPLGLVKYRKALKQFYEAIFAASNHSFYIDSSKYPSRLLHLSEIFDDNQLLAIYLIRDPAAVISSFRSTAGQTPKRPAAAILYYVTINSFFNLLFFIRRNIRSIAVRYEQFISQPESFLDRLSKIVPIDVEPAVNRIRAELPLTRGFLMTSNRMGQKWEVVLRKSKSGPTETLPVKSLAIRLLRRVFM
ncbi:MAG: sulfotransferase [Thiocapsa sp.]|uniref:sulfotransferase n=1 Tax=Thiocapsa sp. TaxID=2024551 RepID=UPI001BCE874C|nr:sulfotransferase [Thiocapsa sp.]QVL50299.1 MAG: sulfotransferase [Thiocapsa sp.]